MGRKNQYGYQEYRGRGGGRGRAVLLFIIALLAVLLAAGTAFYLLVDIEYTPNGMVIHWPWAQESEALPPPPSQPPELPSVAVEVVEPSPSAEPTPTPTPEPVYEPIAAVTVTTAQLRDGSAAQAVAAAGGNALVVEMKGIKGRLAWQSQAELAAALWANAADDLTAQAVRELAANTDLYLVARVQCFRDPLMSSGWVGSLMTRGGNLWHDAQGVGWSSPASREAADYLSQLCLELAEMGFDEILLDSAGYPDSGEVNVLAVNDNRPEDRTVPVAAFWARLSEELKEKGAALSVQTTEDALRGDNAFSGVTAASLAQYAARVWLPAPVKGSDYAAILEGAGLDNTAARVVVKNAVSGSWYK